MHLKDNSYNLGMKASILSSWAGKRRRLSCQLTQI